MAQGKKSVEHTLRVYLWIVGELYLAPHGLTLDDLNERWVLNQELSDGVAMSSRMLANYRDGISKIFGISIPCDRKNNLYKVLYEHMNFTGNHILLAIAIHHAYQKHTESQDRGEVKILIEKQRRTLFNLRRRLF